MLNFKNKLNRTFLQVMRPLHSKRVHVVMDHYALLAMLMIELFVPARRLSLYSCGIVSISSGSPRFARDDFHSWFRYCEEGVTRRGSLPRRGRIAVWVMTRKAAKRSNCGSPGFGLKIFGHLQLELLVIDPSHEYSC